ncbi:hypothetical protein [Culicoidibacter larvae]|uniref:Uncharacterized protein n=1 Tax=Culicoidibacter larvae TaxID=2579976 RepID=A0A5R8Q8F0_9FIRM|nr:hypothetical protein [Culicoidibacter larvae]TLG71410.1 hypothetical protein FEZ08_10980 [Culicoidibacter larvae]
MEVIIDDKKKSKKISKELKVRKIVPASLVGGYPNLSQSIGFALCQNGIYVYSTTKPLTTISMAWDEIEYVSCIVDIDDQTYLKNKSVLGRALVGGVLFGGLGAVVGAISGTGNKAKGNKLTNAIFTIAPKDDGVEEIAFRVDTKLKSVSDHLDGMVKDLKQYVPSNKLVLK